jgi:hypothetical protein
MFLAALLISESRAESKFQTAKPLFIITVDSQKAFDVVSHVIMLDKLYETSLHPALWTIVKDFYSKVKWAGGMSESFNIKQGVRQG